MDKQVSRQRRWQLKRKKEKRCIQCGQSPLVTTKYCFTCRNKANEMSRRRRLARKVEKEGKNE